MAYAGIGRIIIRLLPYATEAALELYAATERKDAPGGFQFRRCQVVFDRSGAEDQVVNVYDFVNITSGEIDTSWTTADFEGVEARLSSFYSSITGFLSSSLNLREFRWQVLPSPAGDTPAVRVGHPINPIVGGGTSSLPHQDAMTITKVVRPRRHWGRIYLGPLSAGMLAQTDQGRFLSNRVTGAATSFQALLTGLQSDDTPMVVFDRTYSRAFTVDGVRVDDIPDIQRRRRADQTPFRSILP
jgi:hypothetical protein